VHSRSLLYSLAFALNLASLFMPMVAEDFLYPVASAVLNGKSHLFLFHQIAPSSAELLLWDAEMKTSFKALSSRFVPAGLTLLPDGTGFSFIDHGRLRIKKFQKRSSRVLEFDEPLYNFGVPVWIDAKHFCVSAWRGKRCGVFQIALRGAAMPLACSDQYDCLYPQKASKTLFYIERSNDGMHRVVSADYPIDALSTFDFDDPQKRMAALMCEDGKEKQPLVSEEKTQEVYRSGKKPIMFLHMVSEDEGFFVEYPPAFNDRDRTIAFSYHCIKKDGNVWSGTHLFSFDLPTSLIVGQGESHLYESILPLKPYHHDDNIYFACCTDSKNKTVNLFCYSLTTKKITQKTFAEAGEQLFAPLVVQDQIFYGGTVQNPQSF